ncbi:MAG: sigma-70 family RNA polymerase sigma factor [Myxococcota bacterium]
MDPAKDSSGRKAPGGVELERDRALLVAFRAGEPEALTRVYRAFAPEIAKLLTGGFSFSSGGRDCRFHGARTTFELEDRLQEVFARAFSERARLGYDGLGPYGAYLRAIARRVVIDDFRRKERAMVSFSWEPPERAAEGAAERPSDPLLGLFAPSADPEQDALRREMAEVVTEVVSELGAREQRVYRLRFVAERDHAFISAETGLSPSKIKTSEERIRKAFFSALRRRGYLEGWHQEEQRGWLRPFRSPMAR